MIAVAGADQPDAAVTAAEPALVEAAHRLDPDQLRRVTTHWRHTVDADRCLADGNVAHDRRYLHISSTFEGLVALDVLLDVGRRTRVPTAVRRLCASATAAASFLAATGHHRGPTPTTSHTGPTVDPPASTISSVRNPTAGAG